jgi:hypothetical protein
VAPLSSPHPVATSTPHRSARRRPAWLFFFLLLLSPHSPWPCRVAGPSAAVLAKVLPCVTSSPSVRVCPEPPRFSSIRASLRYQHRALPRLHVLAPLTPAPTARAKLACPRFYSGRPAFARSCCHSSLHTASAALHPVPALARYCRTLAGSLCPRPSQAAAHSTCSRAPPRHARLLPRALRTPIRATPGATHCLLLRHPSHVAPHMPASRVPAPLGAACHEPR